VSHLFHPVHADGFRFDAQLTRGPIHGNQPKVPLTVDLPEAVGVGFNDGVVWAGLV
jgi:hypothetical protein